jgi:DNA-binding Lrp family transcriptional regulator
MTTDPIDELDRQILHLLQLDARSSDTDMGEEIDVTGTTISNRIEKLQDQGIIRGFAPTIDYEKAGYPMNVLFICSVDLTNRSAFAEKALDVRGVVNVREMLAGEENLHVEVVAESTSEIKKSTEQLDDLGLRIISSNILAEQHVQPWNHFHQLITTPENDTESESDTGSETDTETESDTDTTDS